MSFNCISKSILINFRLNASYPKHSTVFPQRYALAAVFTFLDSTSATALMFLPDNTSSTRSKHRDKNDCMAKQTINNPIKERTSLSKKLTAEIMNTCEFHMPTIVGQERVTNLEERRAY